MWNLNVPAKVKNLCWRIMHGVIPLKSILMKRHIGTTDVCPVCNLGQEDIMHMLFECPTAVNVWRALDLEDVINRVKEIEMSRPMVLEKLLKSPVAKLPGYDSINVQEIIAIASWYIWWLRRRQSHGEQIPPTQNCVTSIRAMAANAAKMNVPMYTQGKKMWLKPGANTLKLNVDATFSEENKNGASGAVLRNSQGVFVAASNKFIPHVASVHMAEALAGLHGLMFANSLGCNVIVIEAESDSLGSYSAMLRS
jgi:hypothetical protein